MHPGDLNSYASWRIQHGHLSALHEGADAPPEKLLQAIWQHQRLQRDQLRTLDGRPVRVLHPGFGSVEGGPDFRGAVLRLGDAEPISGDVEIDLRAAGWRAHGHDRNPAFRNVILHVVWDGHAAASRLPTLVLHSKLDAPLSELSSQLEHNSIRVVPESSLGKCCAPLRELEPEALNNLLREAAEVRFQNKAAQFRARAQQVGWEQSLWEGLFRALGYKNNIWPMQHLAETRVRWNSQTDSLLQIQARLFGLSGLLPADLNRRPANANEYLRSLWDLWWRERAEFADALLPPSLWRLHGLRPANQPQRRIALAAHWVHDDSLVDQIEKWCQSTSRNNTQLRSLKQIFEVAQDDFWSWHWTFRSVRLKKPQTLMGEQRVTDLAMNAVLPWLYARANAGGNQKVAVDITQRYETWPAAEDNSVLRLARQRLLGRSLKARSGLNTACGQQGLLQIVQDFCAHSNAACANCQFPELARQCVSMEIKGGSKSQI